MSDAISDGYEAGCLFRWANGAGTHGMPAVADLEAAGWVKVAPVPGLVGLWVMRRGTTEGTGRMTA